MDSYECRLPQPGERFAVREQLIKRGSLGLLLRQEPGAGDELDHLIRQDMVQLLFIQDLEHESRGRSSGSQICSSIK
jgi:hypothetical protein